MLKLFPYPHLSQDFVLILVSNLFEDWKVLVPTGFRKASSVAQSGGRQNYAISDGRIVSDSVSTRRQVPDLRCQKLLVKANLC